jgi:hypothetical protein
MADGDIPVVVDTGNGPQNQRAYVPRWWLEKWEAIGPAMVDAASRIYDSPSERQRRRADLIFARMHSGRPLASIYDYGSAFRTPYVADPSGFGWKVPINVVQSVIESIASRIAKNRPRVRFLTEGGDFTMQRQAKGLTKFQDGWTRATNLYKKGRRIFRDMGAFGTGLFGLYEDNQKCLVGVDRILPCECIVDEMEAARGQPQSFYIKRPVYRGSLLDMFGKGSPDARDTIENAKGYNPGGAADGRASQMLPVFEGWHLNGKHVVAVAEGTIFSEDWEFDWFPHVKGVWREPDSGYWGLGAAENLLGIQYEVSKMLEKFQRAMTLGAKLWVFRQPGGPTKGQMTNDQMTIIDAETAPTFASPNPMPQQAYDYLWRLREEAYSMEGVSEDLSTGTKPAGLDSAPAQREYSEGQTQRFACLGQEWEELHVEIAEKNVALTKRMVKRGRKVVVKAPDSKLIEQIDFAKVDLDENRSMIAGYPTSSLPTTPAAKLQAVKEYYEAGLIPDRETALALLDFPDLQEALSLQLSAIDDVKRILEKIVEKGQYETPEPFMDLQLAQRMGQAAYLRARNDGVPEKRRDLLIRFIQDVTDLLAEMAPPPAPPPAMLAPGMPGQLPTPAAPAAAPGAPPMPLPGAPAAPMPGPGGLPPS